MQRVLIIGLDPRGLPGVDAATVGRGLAHGLERVQRAGYEVEQLLVPLDESAPTRIERAVTSRSWDVIVVGGGIRKPEPLLELFEGVVNLIRTGAPGAKIAFNTDGGSSLEAIRRVAA
ncbi:MAG TPA: hypothetical protein VH538_04300 [Gaiellaceae bacterium]